MAGFRNTKRLTISQIDDYNLTPFSEGQSYFATDVGVYFKDIHGERLATLEVNSIKELQNENFLQNTLDKLRGRTLLVKSTTGSSEVTSNWYEWYYVDPNSGQAVLLSETSKLSAGIYHVYHDPSIIIGRNINNKVDSITVEACSVNLYSTSNFIGAIRRYSLTDKTWNSSDLNEWPQDLNRTYYIIADYNYGDPILRITPDVGIINESNIIPVFTIVRTDNNIHYISWEQLGAGLSNKLHQRLVKTQRFAKETGLATSIEWTTSGTLKDTSSQSGYYLNITGGTVWNGGMRNVLNSIDTRNDKIRFYFHDVNDGGNWNYFYQDSILNTTEYDNGSQLITIQDDDSYSTAWVFRGVFQDTNYVGYILGEQDYNSKSEATNAPMPQDLPDIFRTLAIPIAKIVFEKSASETGNIEVINITEGTGGSSSGTSTSLSHNDLPGRSEDNAHPMSSISPNGEYQVLTITNRSGSVGKIDETILKVESSFLAPTSNLQEWKAQNSILSAINGAGEFTGISDRSKKINFNLKTAQDTTAYPLVFTNNTIGGYNNVFTANNDLIKMEPNSGKLYASQFVGNASSADEIKTGLISTNADYFLTFVNENSAGRTNKNIYTNANIKYNPTLNGGTLNIPNLITGTITATDYNIVHAEDLYTEKDHIILRDGATTALPANYFTGLIAKIPDGTKDAALVFDGDGMARVGDITYSGTTPIYTATQILATRQDSPISNSLFFWNASQKRMDSSGITWNGTTLDGTYQISISGVRKDTLWDTAYAERGSVIGGNKLTWNGTQLDLDILNFNDVDFANQNLLTISSPTFVGLAVNSLVLKGISFNTTLTKTEPTAARTITFPNASGTVVLSDGAVTSGFVPVWNGTTGGLLGDGYKVQDSSANAALSTNADLVTERDVYYGLIRVNNSTQTRANIIYAPITGGTVGQALRAVAATSAPVWESPADSITASAIGTGSTLVTERDIYYGLPTINNSHAYNSSTKIYAPNTGGTLGYTLVGTGTTTAPTWSSLIFNDTVNSRVGIGTTSPSALLSIGGNGEPGSFSVTGGSVGNIAVFRDKYGENIFGAQGSVADNDLDIYFGDRWGAGSEVYYKITSQYHVFSGGNVGIGTAAPTKLLDVNGETRVRSQLTVDSIITIGNLIIQDTAPADPNSGYIDIKFMN